MTEIESMTRRIVTKDSREYLTMDGDLLILRRKGEEWLVTATINDAALTQVQGLVRFNEAGFRGRQWESDIDGQQHATLTEAALEALRIARFRADITAFIRSQTVRF